MIIVISANGDEVAQGGVGQRLSTDQNNPYCNIKQISKYCHIMFIYSKHKDYNYHVVSSEILAYKTIVL